MARLYGDPLHRPRKCGCSKVAYRDEAEALAAADRQSAIFDTNFRAYKCPGHQVWHLTTSGFHPRALKSHARILAWHLSARRVTTADWLLEQVGVTADESGRRSSKGKRISAILRTFAELGLVTLDDPRPPYIAAADPDGLLRVMAVGLQEYAESKGVNVTRPTMSVHRAEVDRESAVDLDEAPAPD